MKMPLLLRFLVVGGINTGFSYCVYVVLAFTGLNYALANLGSLIAGILFSFKAQGRFVFRNSDRSLFWRFVLCWALIYAANVWFITQAMRLGMIFTRQARGDSRDRGPVVRRAAVRRFRRQRSRGPRSGGTIRSPAGRGVSVRRHHSTVSARPAASV